MGNRIEAIVPLCCSDCLSTTWAFTLTRCQCSSPLETTANLFVWASIHELHQKSKGRATFSSNANACAVHARPINTYNSLSYTHRLTQKHYTSEKKGNWASMKGTVFHSQSMWSAWCKQGANHCNKLNYISMTIGQKMVFVVFTCTFFFHPLCSSVSLVCFVCFLRGLALQNWWW